jgi:hypothetical protein
MRFYVFLHQFLYKIRWLAFLEDCYILKIIRLICINTAKSLVKCIIFSKVSLFSSLSRALNLSSISRKYIKAPYSVYFAKGNDPRLLDISQQLEISEFIKRDDLSSSILVYNPSEALNKIASWNKALPWIKPHYAIKSSPS